MTDRTPAPLRPETDQPTTPNRWWRYRKRGRLACPSGHHIPNTQRIPESGFIRCSHWNAEQRAECGRWIFVYAIRGGGCVVVEVQLAELQDLEAFSTPGEVVEYLGIFDADDDTAPRPPARAPHHHRDRR